MLKINSNFSDYYDCAIGSFVDSDVVINRKNERIHVNVCNEFPHSVIQNSLLYDYSFGYFDEAVYEFCNVQCVGFCGKWYYLTSIHKNEDIIEQYLTFDELMKSRKKSSLFSDMFKYRDIIDLNKDEFFSKEFFEKYGPVIYCKNIAFGKLKRGHYNNDKDRLFEIEKFPCLKNLNFSAVLNPYTALWELDHWYDSHAIPDSAIVPVGDDIVRLQAYGFDKKTSFRKMTAKL